MQKQFSLSILFFVLIVFIGQFTQAQFAKKQKVKIINDNMAISIYDEYWKCNKPQLLKLLPANQVETIIKNCEGKYWPACFQESAEQMLDSAKGAAFSKKILGLTAYSIAEFKNCLGGVATLVLLIPANENKQYNCPEFKNDIYFLIPKVNVKILK